MCLAKTPPEVLQFVVQQSRAAGNEAYRKREYAGALAAVILLDCLVLFFHGCMMSIGA